MGIFKSKEEKEFLKAQKKADKEMMKQINEEIKEQDRKDYEKFIDEMLLEDDKEEKYLESIMTDEEKKEMLDQKNQQTAILVIASIIMSIAIVLVVVIAFTADYKAKSELVKNTVPVLKEYYKNRYNKELRYRDIDYLCIDKGYKDKECSNIAMLTTQDNYHIFAIDNNMIGDDISTDQIKKEYNDNMRSYLGDLDLVSNYPILSYKDYYMDYNIHYDYIYALPANIDYKTMRSTKKLTVTEFIFYKGDFNANLVKTFVSNFSEDSVFYFIKNIMGIPSNLKVVTSKNIIDLDITASIPLDKGIYYELDRNKNYVTSISVEKVNGNDITTEGDYKYTNCFKIETTTNIPYEVKGKVPTYFFIKLDDVDFNEKNIYQFTVSSYDRDMNEVDSTEYTQIITFNNGSGTYIIGTESVGIGNLYTEESLACKLGLC